MRKVRRACFASVLAVAFVGCGEEAGQGGGDDMNGGAGDLAGADLSGGGGSDGGDGGGGGGDMAVGPDMSACTMPQACYSGPQGTAGVGACSAGTQFCLNGVLGPCIGEVGPSAESCNGVDDDCNGKVDDGLADVTCGIGACRNTVYGCTNGRPTVCMPKAAAQETCGNGIDEDCNGLIDEVCGCVYVAPTGSDMNGTGAANAPFRTIGKAIMMAGTGNLPKTVCVASGAVCPSQFDYAEQVTMRDGVSVYGNYQAAGNMWPRNPQCVTRIQDQQHNGVTFDDTVKATTILDGFVVLGHVDPTSAAVSVFGSTGAQVSNCIVVGAGTMTSYGVNVTDQNGTAATPLIARSGIIGGGGTTLSIGVHSINSAPTLLANCDTIDMNSGRCTSGGCGNNLRGIRGRAPNANGTETYGVRLENSPGTLIEQNAICGNTGSGDVAGVRLSGDAKNVVIHANRLDSFGQAVNSVAFWADPCAGASPWVLNNQALVGSSGLMGGRADGARVIGDCHARIDSNVTIVGGVESANNDANGVFCVKDQQSGISSKCTVLNNANILGAGQGFPPRSAGVHCDDGACARIENNVISANSGVLTWGVRLQKSGAFVNRNVIAAGCATKEGIGLSSEGSFARVQNNIIAGAGCQNGGATGDSWGVRVFVEPGQNELDLHSNTILSGGTGGQCTARGVSFDLMPMGAPPTGPLGVLRNDIVYATGNCPTRYNIDEQNAAADPRLLENNDLWYQANPPTALYRDEAMTNLTMLMQVNMLMSSPTAAANLSADPLLNMNLHLPNNSPCVNAGTATGAPAVDIDGDARPQLNMFDIGADEFRP